MQEKYSKNRVNDAVTEDVSIPAHFEPPVRTLRATIPTNESQYSRAWKLLFRTWETMIPARWKSL